MFIITPSVFPPVLTTRAWAEEKSNEAFWHSLRKSISIGLPLSPYRLVYIWVSKRLHILPHSNSRFYASRIHDGRSEDRFVLLNYRLTINNDRLRTRSSLTILYCSSSILARLESLSNIDTLKPSDIAKLSWMTGCNCLWSPIKTTCLAPEHVIGTRDSSSMHMPHSSTMHCWIFSQDLVSLGFPDAVHVQRMIWTPVSWRTQLSACPISLWKRKKKIRNKNLQIWHGQTWQLSSPDNLDR